MRTASVVLVTAALAGCTPSTGAGRRAWLQQQIVAENMLWLSTSPDWLVLKYEKMASDPYFYMRGTAGTYYNDLARQAVHRSQTAFLSTPEASQILLLGDAHPENFGTMLPGSAPPPYNADLPDSRDLTLEFNDLDAAIYGPWLLDLRRAALGVAVLTTQLDGCDDDCLSATTAAQAEGYAAGALGEPAPSALGEIVSYILDEALEEGPEQKKTNKYTAIGDDGVRALVYDEVLDDEDKGIFPLSAAEQDQLDRLLADYDAPEGFRVLGSGRRYGSGVSSLPAVRYIVLYDLGDDGVEDDSLLNIREIIDPPTVPGLFAEPGDRFIDNADRIEQVSRWLWSVPDADAAARGMLDGAHSFKSLTWTSWQQNLDHLKIVEKWDEGKYDEDDLVAMARLLGWHIGAAHRRAPTASGADAGPILAAELDGRAEALAAELVSAVAADLQTTLSDVDTFQTLLTEAGPLLGADVLPVDVLR